MVGVLEATPLPEEPHAVAPDGMLVRVLPGLAGGSFAHFELPSGATSVAARHRTVEEIWHVTGGGAELWRRSEDEDRVDEVGPGTTVTIPLGTAFQLRSTTAEPMTAVACTMPPWPGDDEAVRVDGLWAPTLQPGPGLS
jgi:mannose-6-phosphate isomerase-like protein (cupin superfamily)